LKLPSRHKRQLRLQGIASQQREAWIETADWQPPISSHTGIASQQREAWIETCGFAVAAATPCRIASQQREAWIETASVWSLMRMRLASPPSNGRRGLKRESDHITPPISRHRLPATGGVD